MHATLVALCNSMNCRSNIAQLYVLQVHGPRCRSIDYFVLVNHFVAVWLFGVTLNNASHYRTNGLYRTPNLNHSLTLVRWKMALIKPRLLKNLKTSKVQKLGFLVFFNFFGHILFNFIF